MDDAGRYFDAAFAQQLAGSLAGHRPGDVVGHEHAVRAQVAPLDIAGDVVQNAVADVNVLLRLVVLAGAVAL